VKAISQIIQRARTQAQLSQRELASRAQTTQSVVARIESGKTTPTVDTVERLIVAAGFDINIEITPRAAPDPVIDAFKRDIDRSLLRQNLAKSPDERLRALRALQRLAAEARRAGAQARAKK